MQIQRFYDDELAQATYVLSDGGQAVVIDPARDVQPVIDYLHLTENNLYGILLTHPHADLAGGQWELQQRTQAPIHISDKVKTTYPVVPLKAHSVVRLSEDLQILTIETPGHSPDSLTFLVNYRGNDVAIFTGDTLLIGSTGRPNVRQSGNLLGSDDKKMARDLYHSLTEKIAHLDPSARVYPLHGSGSLCGKEVSDQDSTTLQEQLDNNPAFQQKNEQQFVQWALEGQPYVPKYFSKAFQINTQGAAPLREALAAIPRYDHPPTDLSRFKVVDTRPADQFNRSHYPDSFNIGRGNSFATWLGSIINPDEDIFLITEQETDAEELLRSAAKIGYEGLIRGVAPYRESPDSIATPDINLYDFKLHPDHYTIVDVRQPDEARSDVRFNGALNFPLYELRERAGEIPRDRPVVVHCASGYRSGVGSSILQALLARSKNMTIHDLGDYIREFN